MNRGLVYVWKPDARLPLTGRLEKALVDLGQLGAGPDGRPQLRSRLVEVRNGGRRYKLDAGSGRYTDIRIGNAEADCNGDFCFEAGKGGGRLDKDPFAAEDFQERYVQASHFGEVNSFYHLHKIATYIDDLLYELGEPSLPLLIAVVNAHHAVTMTNGIKDGLHVDEYRCHPFQGGHYRLPSRRNTVAEHHTISINGEVHLGPGRKLLDGGALVEFAGSSYRANASHNAGIIYHEYGHHITRHTADFMVNRRCEPLRQNNRKAAIDEGLCDYWTAAMLETPHIWAMHKRHDAEHQHPRSLASPMTMEDFDPSARADPHTNGTIWAAALWDLRGRLQQRDDDGARKLDLMVLKALTLTGRDGDAALDIKTVRRVRASFPAGLTRLIEVDDILFGGRFSDLIVECFAKRKIFADASGLTGGVVELGKLDLPNGLKRLPPEEIPASQDILSKVDLERLLERHDAPTYSLIGVGDIMLGDRTIGAIEEHGDDYPFTGVLPLLRRSAVVCGNLEGPFASNAGRQDRTYAYRVDPRLAHALKRANVNVVTLANNHLLDCGREGVVETFDALHVAGVQKVGAGRNEEAAHEPVIIDAGSVRVGILAYYWNKRCAATLELPGSAIGDDHWLKADIASLRQRAARIVVVFHWGVPYQEIPLADDQAKARLAVDLGADLVIGHHPHVIQPFEVYKGRPIFYSVGNFTFGSGNSRAEGLMVAARFEPRETVLDVFPIYVKNRDPRVNYQPKVLGGTAARTALERLAAISGSSGQYLRIAHEMGRLRLPAYASEERAT